MNIKALNNVPDDAIVEARWTEVHERPDGAECVYGGVSQLGTARDLKACLPGEADSWMVRRADERVNTLP